MVMQPKNGTRVGLALAGGGPEGAIYEIGALCALETAIDGLRLNQLPVYVGVSAGAFIASSLANQLSTAQMVRALVKSEPGVHPFTPGLFLTPAFTEFARSGVKLPRLLMEAAEDYLANRKEQTLVKSLTRLARAIPVGLFDNRPLLRYLQTIFNKPGRTDDFRQLKAKLHVVATDLDSGRAVVFGKDTFQEVPISLAVQASTALPGFYPPVEINRRHFVDGVLLRTLHASTVLDEGVDLAICVNPIVPVDTSSSVEKGFMRRGKLIDRGMPGVLAQTMRTLIHSRMIIGFRRYGRHYEDRDILLFEPSRDDYRMFFTNIFSFSSRKAVAEHAFLATLKDLRNRRDTIEPVLEKHGLRLRDDILRDPLPDLWHHVGLEAESKHHPVSCKLNEALSKLESALQIRKEEPELLEAQA